MEKNVLKFNEDFIKNYDGDCDKGYIFHEDVEYPKHLHDLHNDLPFLSERIKINKCNKLVCSLYDKKLCFLYKIIETCIRSWTDIKESS